MSDVWTRVERWNAARAKVSEPRNAPMLDLLERHAVWLLSRSGENRAVCENCDNESWPCKVFREIEAVL